MSRVEKKRGKREKSDNVFLTKFYLEKKTLKAFSNLKLKGKGRDFHEKKETRRVFRFY